MAENKRQLQPKDPFDRFDEAINDPRLYETDHFGSSQYAPLPALQLEQPYTPQRELLANEPVPLFLSNYEDEPPYQPAPEYSFGRKKTSPSRILTGLIAVSAIAMGLALLSIDSTRAVIVNAKAALIGEMPGAAQPALAAVAEPAATPDIATTHRAQPGALTSASPSRDEIAAAYQSALKTKVVLPEPAVREAPVAAPARRIEPDELAALLKRAKGLLAIGDITSARLLLERAADAQEAEAALMLAGTYDPQVLGTQDMRSITPDPAAARLWYQRAAQLGSSDAKRRLGQIQN